MKKQVDIRKTLFHRGPLHISYTRRSADLLWGRFGGGWQWALGFRMGSTTLLINLLICSVTIVWKRLEA